MKKTLLLASIGIAAFNVMAQGDSSGVESFKPGKITEYDWRSGDWKLSNTSSFSYDEEGRVLAETGKYQKTEYEYDSNGMIVSQTVSNINDAGVFTPAQKVEYTYDPVVTNFKTSATNYYWRDGQWKISDSSRQLITRDDAGNITKIENQDLKDGSYVTSDEYCDISYGSDGRAVSITCYEEDYDGASQTWEVSLKLTDIVWDKTNGQIIDLYDTDDLSDFFQGANRIKSATIAQGDYPGTAFLAVTYTADGYGYDSQTTYNGEIVDTEKLTVLDQYGSFTLEAYYTDFDYDEDKGTWENDGSYYFNETKKYDRFGIVIEDTEEDMDANGKVTSGDYERGEVSYDSQTGMPVEYVVQKKYSKTSDFSNDEKYVYSDYSAGISAIGSNPDANEEYYNLNGIKISQKDSSNGIYIIRKGNETVKVIR